MPRLILASASPRRRELLTSLGLGFEVVVTEAEEVAAGLDPEALVVENAARKAVAGWKAAGAGEEDVVLACDTEVFLDGRALGKAADVAEARERLLALSGRTHEVLSGVAIATAATDGRAMTPGEAQLDNRGGVGASAGRPPSLTTGIARSLVTFRALDEPTLNAYLASGEWHDRAGAYAIQGLGSVLVETVQGDFSNVVGLPLRLLLELAPGLFMPISSGSGG